MGDAHRQKLPHGPFWNKLNLVGQAVLLVAFVLLFIRIGGWIWPETWMHTSFELILNGKNSAGVLVNPLSYKWTVDILLGGLIGVGLYYKYSGPCLVSLCLSARGSDAYLCAFYQISDLGRQEKMYLLITSVPLTVIWESTS